MYSKAIEKGTDITALIETPEEYIEYPANELEFDNVCLYPTAESLEICMKHHHGNLDKLPEYLYMMLIKILDIVNMLYFSYGVGSPCRTACTVCGSPPCMKNKSH